MTDTKSAPAKSSQSSDGTRRKRSERPGNGDEAATAAPAAPVDTTGTKSPETTYQKQLFIVEVLQKSPELSLNKVMEAVHESFGTRIAFDRAKEAKEAFEKDPDNPVIQRRDGRRTRGRQITRHESGICIVAVVQNDDIIDTFLVEDDEEAQKKVLELVATGAAERDAVQIYQRCRMDVTIKLD